MSISQHLLTVETDGQGLHEVTRPIAAWVAAQRVRRGLLTIFIRHTSAALLIQENAAAAVRRDLDAFMKRLAPEDPRLYTHNDEGEDDMPAHIRSALTQTSLSIPIRGGAMLLGTWQAIYVFEHRDRGHSREIAAHAIGA